MHIQKKTCVKWRKTWCRRYLSLSLSVMFSFDCYTHTYIHTREEKRMTKQNNSMCVCVRMYVCTRSLQFKPDGVYVLFFSLILVRANTNRRRLSAMYKPFIILAPVQQQLNSFFFSLFFFFFLYWTKVITKKSMLTGLLHIHALIYK